MSERNKNAHSFACKYYLINCPGICVHNTVKNPILGLQHPKNKNSEDLLAARVSYKVSFMCLELNLKNLLNNVSSI
jgi:hypothetical protein